MALMDHAATSRALSQELGSFARQQIAARTVRRRLQQYGLSARRPRQWLLLTLHHGQKRLQWGEKGSRKLPQRHSIFWTVYVKSSDTVLAFRSHKDLYMSGHKQGAGLSVSVNAEALHTGAAQCVTEASLF
ncbi:hypothetical protein TNCV_1956601 [Trichonephila clavipes]|nr:hypothetical protein TNCV_1956601 [Trichonephila clavipes]